MQAPQAMHHAKQYPTTLLKLLSYPTTHNTAEVIESWPTTHSTAEAAAV